MFYIPSSRRNYYFFDMELLRKLFLVLFCFGSALFAEELLEPSSWQAMRDWLGNPAEGYGVVQLEDGTLDFFVREVGRGMKWKRNLYIDIARYRWLIVEYRCLNYNPQASDYILWVNDGYPEGIRFTPDDIFKTDGEWHTAVVDLYDHCRGPYLYQIALQTQAKERDAHLLIRKLHFSEKPPAEGVTKVREIKTVSIDINPGLWEAHRDWLGNPAGDFGVIKREGTLFYVGEAGKGMKWSLSLKDSLKGLRWVTVRYKARNLNPLNDYFLYIANAPGGKAPREEFPILISSLDADGEWHTQIAPLKIEEINTVAIQVQASSQQAEVEIAQISFSDQKPVLFLEELLPYQEKKYMAKGFKAISLPKVEANIKTKEIQERFSFDGWFKSDLIEVRGITFSLKGMKSFPVAEHKGQITIPLQSLGKCSELYLLLASDLPKWEEPSFGGGEMRKIRQIERLKVRLVYEDGDWYEQFPLRLSSGKFEVIKGIDVYAIAVRKKAKELQLINGMNNATFALLALTSSEKPGPASSACTPKSPPIPRTKTTLPSRPSSCKVNGDAISMELREGTIVLDLSKGIKLRTMRNNWLFKEMQISPSPLFSLFIENKRITSEEFKVVKTNHKEGSLQIIGEYRDDKLSLECYLEIWQNKEGEIAFSLLFSNKSGVDLKISAIFPILRDIDLGTSAEDTYYFYPCKGGAINNKDWNFRSYYSGEFPLQIMGLFSYKNGGGIYLRTEDLEVKPKWYVLSKKGEKGSMEIEYLLTDLPAGNTLNLAKSVIGFSRGDWRSQLKAYIDWKDSWYKPAVPRKKWFREVFNFRQQFLFFEMPTKSPIFDPKKKECHIEETLKIDEELFGGVDYLHIFDWAYTPQYGRVGDYDHWEELGGVENFRRAIEKTQGKGIPVGLYIEGYLVDPPSNLGKSKGKEWQILDREGNPMQFFAPSYNMCPCLPAWRDYLANTYARVKRETGAKGYYIDEYGFALEARNCWNKSHNHPIPCSPVRGEFLTTKAVREALGEDVVVYTEESPVDVTSQYQDGSFTYAISSISDELSPSHLNLYRFVFPDFKTFEIIVCDQPLGSNVQAVKRILFNGEGIWLEGMKEWFSDDVLAYIRKYHKVVKENADCFTSLYPEPLVPTFVAGVYANKFPSRRDGKGKVIWTIYNTNPFTIDGELIGVEYVSGASFKDVLNDREIRPRKEGNKAYLSLKIPPQDVIVIKMEE